MPEKPKFKVGQRISYKGLEYVVTGFTSMRIGDGEEGGWQPGYLYHPVGRPDVHFTRDVFTIDRKYKKAQSLFMGTSSER